MTTETLIACAVAFFGGAVYEAGCVGWVHYSERGRPGMTALFSMACATAQVAGIGESVHSLVAAPFFVAGFGTGTYLAVRIKMGKALDCVPPSKGLEPERKGDDR